SLELLLKERELEAEQKALAVIEKAEEKAEAIVQEARQNQKYSEEKLDQKESHLTKREEFLDNRQMDIESQKESLQSKIDEIKSIKARIDERQAEIEQKYEEVAGLTKEEAVEAIIKKAESEHAEDLRARLAKLERQGSEAYEEEANNLLLAAIHRVGNNIPSNVMTAHVE